MEKLWSKLAATRRPFVRRLAEAYVRPHWAPARWLRPPAAFGDAARVCVFVMLAHRGRLLPHSVDHARAWAEAGYEVVAVVIVDTLRRRVDIGPLGFAAAVLVRINIGYDFGAWAAAIRRLEAGLPRLGTLALANDSLLGPSRRFAAMLDRAAASEADVVGITESGEVAPHTQSFVVFFHRRALRAAAFRRFWRNVRSGGRTHVIENYEIPLRRRFDAAGLRTEAIFERVNASGENPTLRDWRELLALGFPYFKVALLRDNPLREPLHDWRDQAERHGFDLAALNRQLAALEQAGGGRWAYRTAAPAAP